VGAPGAAPTAVAAKPAGSCRPRGGRRKTVYNYHEYRLIEPLPVRCCPPPLLPPTSPGILFRCLSRCPLPQDVAWLWRRACVTHTRRRLRREGGRSRWCTTCCHLSGAGFQQPLHRAWRPHPRRCTETTAVTVTQAATRQPRRRRLRCGGRCVLFGGRLDWDLPTKRLFFVKKY
jgi:hypothetical protein